VLDRSSGSLRGAAGGLVEREATGEERRQRCRVRATCAVGGGDLVSRDRDLHVDLAVEEVIDRVSAVASGHDHRRSPESVQALGELVAILCGSAGESLRFLQVRRYDRRQREEPAHERSDCVLLQESCSGARHHHRVDHQRHPVVSKEVGGGLDDRRREEHARLGRVHAQVGEDGLELSPHELGRHLVDSRDPGRVLRGQGHDRTHPETAGGRESLQVGLDAGAPTGVRAGDGQAARDGHAGIIESVETPARYDGLAEWYDREFATSPLSAVLLETVLHLLGEGGGRALVDVGCGTGAHDVVYSEHGWVVTGIDISEDQLRLARGRGIEVVHADATAIPFADASFDAAVSTWIHTDVEDFAAVLAEVARVLRPASPFVYLGAHPCFVGPHSQFVAAEGLPVLHEGYRRAERYSDAPGTSPEGLRARVGATHLPLGRFVQSFIDAGFGIEHFEEPGSREYPYMVALRCRR
jgi:SAM-dependent methyltransferase